jgi:hypothetical protein
VPPGNPYCGRSFDIIHLLPLPARRPEIASTPSTLTILPNCQLLNLLVGTKRRFSTGFTTRQASTARQPNANQFIVIEIFPESSPKVPNWPNLRKEARDWAALRRDCCGRLLMLAYPCASLRYAYAISCKRCKCGCSQMPSMRLRVRRPRTR